MSADHAIWGVVSRDPVRRRRLIRRAARGAIRLGLDGPGAHYHYRVQDTAVVASVLGIDVGAVDVFEDRVAHD